MAIFLSNQGGGLIEKHRFLFKLLAFYSTEIIKFYSTLKMSLSHAEKVSCHLKQNQGVASLTNFCDAEPIRKKIYQIFRIRKATKKREDSLEQKKFVTCK